MLRNMEKVGFIGGYDKTDFILYIAKILTLISKRVLIVDTTISQKARYSVPTISPTLSYITTYEDIDIAVGFYSPNEINEYLGGTNLMESMYDYVLIDIDSSVAIKNFDISKTTKNYFVTSFELYSIRKGLEALNQLREPISLTKVFFSKQMTKEQDDYFNFVALGYKAIWNEYRIYFPLEQGDQSAIIENQMVSKIRIKNLTQQYREGLEYIAEEIVGTQNKSVLKKAFKQLEKGE